DLFDVGFATESAVETAVARLLEDQGGVLREPVVNAHPLVEQRSESRPLEVREVLQPGAAVSPKRRSRAGRSRSGLAGTAAAEGTAATEQGSATAAGEPVGLTLQLLPEPRTVTVETVRRRDHVAPVRYR